MILLDYINSFSACVFIFNFRYECVSMNYNIGNVFKTTNQIDTYHSTLKYYNLNIVSGRKIIYQVYIYLYIFIVVLYNVYITAATSY